MYRIPYLPLAGVLVVPATLFLSGCSGVDQLADPNPAFETLVVAYGDPGPTTVPCDDVLPIIDGFATDQEWSSAQPIFVRMSGINGNGGADYFLEIRAIWTDEGTRLGGDGRDRIYFMIRYPDNDADIRPDQLAYIYDPLDYGEPLCDSPVIAGNHVYCPGPIPRVREVEIQGCDTLLVKNKYWNKLNQRGREDQVFVLLTEAFSQSAATSLIDLNRELLGKLGPGGGAVDVETGSSTPVDLWAWRAGRTNLHPVPQFPDWARILPENPVPPPLNSRFVFTCGFCEDLWLDSGADSVGPDQGLTPYIRNFGTTFPEPPFGTRVGPTGEILDTVPVFLTQCPPRGRDPSEEELANLNGGLPKDLALWRHSATFFRSTGCDSLACSRPGGRPPKWSLRLLPGEFDYLQGWALRVPYKLGDATSGRDVRARAIFEANQDKGFTNWSLEIMRELNTGQFDDIVINPNTSGEFRMVIGVLDASGRVGSGSTEIRLKFEARTPRFGAVNRC